MLRRHGRQRVCERLRTLGLCFPRARRETKLPHRGLDRLPDRPSPGLTHGDGPEGPLVRYVQEEILVGVGFGIQRRPRARDIALARLQVCGIPTAALPRAQARGGIPHVGVQRPVVGVQSAKIRAGAHVDTQRATGTMPLPLPFPCTVWGGEGGRE